MPLKDKYRKIKAEMVKEYGEEKGEKIFWSWVNKENVNPDVKAFYFTSECLKALDDDYVEGAIATGNPDAYNDILTEDCLKDMERQLKSLPITIDDDHESFKSVPEEEKFRSVNPLAKVVDAKLDGLKINVKTILNKAHARYEEIKSSIRNGFLHSFSFAFIPIETKSVDIGGVKHRVVNKVRLLNGCFTGIPVNEKATFSNVMLKSLAEFDYDEVEVNKIVRGVEMDEKKEDVKSKEAEGEQEESKEEKQEVQEEKSNVSEEVKSLVEKIDALEKSVSELKSKSERSESDEKDDKKEKDEDEEDEGSKEEKKSKVDVLEEQVAGLKAKLEEPQMKARVENSKEINEEKGAEEVKSKGPLDMIK